MIYDLRFTISIVTAVTLVTAVPASEPVEFPKLEAYGSLWERSLFTTKDLPAPDAPAGPSFADNLSLSGVYELQGEVVALIVDKTTSQVFQAKIGSENEIGVKVRKIDGDITSAKIRVQLQKGDQVGWLTLSDGLGAPSETIAPAGVPAVAQPGLQTRQMPAPAAASAGLLLPPNAPAALRDDIPQIPTITPEAEPAANRRIAPAPAPTIPQSPPASAPPPPVAVPPAQQVDGIPLPPP
jgi:hypothetical protein